MLPSVRLPAVQGRWVPMPERLVSAPVLGVWWLRGLFVGGGRGGVSAVSGIHVPMFSWQLHPAFSCLQRHEGLWQRQGRKGLSTYGFIPNSDAKMSAFKFRPCWRSVINVLNKSPGCVCLQLSLIRVAVTGTSAGTGGAFWTPRSVTRGWTVRMEVTSLRLPVVLPPAPTSHSSVGTGPASRWRKCVTECWIVGIKLMRNSLPAVSIVLQNKNKNWKRYSESAVGYKVRYKFDLDVLRKLSSFRSDADNEKKDARFIQRFRQLRRQSFHPP